jgi:hypothetical protein
MVNAPASTAPSGEAVDDGPLSLSFLNAEPVAKNTHFSLKAVRKEVPFAKLPFCPSPSDAAPLGYEKLLDSLRKQQSVQYFEDLSR